MGQDKLWALIGGVDVAMFTTWDGRMLHSRPLAALEHGPGELLFFTAADSAKVIELGRSREVSVTYADTAKNVYVAVAGSAEVVRDPALAHKLWKPHQRAFFPLGPDDPTLVLLRVRPRRAEYWERSSGAVVNAIGLVRTLLTDAPYQPGANEKLELDG